MRTSISDTDNYKNICRNASINKNVFNNFKRDPSYVEILEHSSVEDGFKYIEFIKKNEEFLTQEVLSKFKENDEQGNPNIVKFPEPFGWFSPSTLRYVKILLDLKNIFGTLENKKIIEIGVGYGGQSKLIMDYFNVSEYNFVDLPEVLDLTKNYLKKYNYKNLNFYTIDELPDKDFDIVISNYAFTECEKNIQNVYLDKIINKSKSGYIIGNYIGNFFNINVMTSEELIKIIKHDVNLTEEKPLTHPNNYVLIWGSEK